MTTHALIIDDDLYNLKVLEKLLAREGLTSTILQDPTKLEDAIQGVERVDLIFLDLEMPKINGFEMLGILREKFGLTVPIIACTVHTGEMDTARQLGFHSFLGKPLQADRFSDQLRSILNGEKVWTVD